MKKSQLHARAESNDDGTWVALLPHPPGPWCGKGRYDPCPRPDVEEPCQHRHASSDAALRCSRNRPPFKP